VERSTESVEAYNLYLQGRHHWNRRTADGLQRAIDLFTRASEIDPNFALAFAGLADAWVLMPEKSDVPGDEAFPRAKEAALRALALNDSLAEAHTSLGQVMRLFDRNFEAAEREFRRAVELNADYATTHHWLGMNLFFDLGRPEEGLSHLERAERLDPISGVIKFSLGGVLRAQGHLDEALEKYLELRDIDPTYPVYNALSSAYFQKREFDESAEALRQKRARSRLSIDDWISLTGTLHLDGEHAAELEEARAARRENPNNWNAVFLEARALLGLGRHDDMWGLVSEGSGLTSSFSAGPHLLSLAEELNVHGQRSAAAAMARRTLDLYQALFDLGLPPEPAYRFAQSSALLLAGDARQARSLFDRAAAEDRLGSRILPEEEFLGYSGSLAARAGDPGAARRVEEKLAGSGVADRGSRLFWRAAIAASLGEKQRAVDLLDQAFDGGFWAYGRAHRLPFFEPIWGYGPYRDLLTSLGLPAPGVPAARPSPTAG
jgi:tetratricopeptide (TPR) repeat protein